MSVMESNRCQCNHLKQSHTGGRCTGRYLTGAHMATDTCECTEFRPLTPEQEAAYEAAERLMRE